MLQMQHQGTLQIPQFSESLSSVSHLEETKVLLLLYMKKTVLTFPTRSGASLQDPNHEGQLGKDEVYQTMSQSQHANLSTASVFERESILIFNRKCRAVHILFY